jgi:DNA-binding transcriptional LysR family regulator
MVMELEDLRAFAEVAAAGGLTKAGRKMGISKSILSRRLTRLELTLGVTLLNRTPRGISLTEKGANFRHYAERAIAELDAARNAVVQEDDLSGTLRVAAQVSFGITHIAPALAELSLRYPRLQIQSFYSDKFVDLIGDRFDAAVWIGNLTDSSLVAKRIAKIRSGVVASPDYIERHGRPLTIDDVSHHRTLIHTDQVWRFRQGNRMVTIRPEPNFIADNSQALLAAARAGLGLALLPSYLIGPGLEDGSLVPVLEDLFSQEEGLYLVRPPSAGAMPSKVRVLSDVLTARFGRDVNWDPCQLSLSKVQNGQPQLLPISQEEAVAHPMQL